MKSKVTRRPATCGVNYTTRKFASQGMCLEVPGLVFLRTLPISWLFSVLYVCVDTVVRYECMSMMWSTKK